MFDLLSGLQPLICVRDFDAVMDGIDPLERIKSDKLSNKLPLAMQT